MEPWITKAKNYFTIAGKKLLFGCFSRILSILGCTILFTLHLNWQRTEKKKNTNTNVEENSRLCHKSGQSEATKGTHIKHLKLKNFQPNTKCLLREHASLFSQASPHLSAGFVLFLFYYDHKFLSHAIAHFDLLIELYVTRNINCARDDTKYTRIQRF